MDERVQVLEQGEDKKEERRKEKVKREKEEREEKDERGGREGKKRGDRRKGKGRKRRLTGSLAAKIVAFFLLGISCLAGMGSLFFIIYMDAYGVYSESRNEVLLDALSGTSWRAMHEVSQYIERGEIKSAEAFCEDRNIDFELIWMIGESEEYVLWGTWDGYDTNLTTDWYVSFDVEQSSKAVVLKHHALRNDEMYLLRSYIDPDFPKEDGFQSVARLVGWLYDMRYGLIAGAAVSIFLCIACFLFLLCSAGHRNDREGIVPGVLTGIPVDVLTALLGVIIAIMFAMLIETGWSARDGILVILMLFEGVALAVLLTFYFMDIALRVKLGIGLRHSLIYKVVRCVGRVFSFLGRGICFIVRGLPLVLTTVIAYLGVCIVEFICVLLVVWSSESVILWGLEKVLLLIGIIYIALNCRKLLEAGRALAEGKADYQVDTSKMFGAFKEHGDNLNSLGQGIAKAVSERMRSEHLKTELITNVSHDIKTPLTSIINYADLICEEVGMRDSGEASEISDGDAEAGTTSQASQVEYARVTEYAEVLLRQSRRLKKLLEDLVEASKATTGNLEMNLEPCEVGVLLSQAVGEYQQRMAEKELELIARQPESPVEIMADGRRLWRVFDNLLNNICKYAQESSRVYLSVEVREGNVLVIFRNMSKYPLDISAEELEERFVRGDRSRHMEGNGLGLSIAKSLVELQNGRMDIVIDGDLFKVTLSFRVLSGGSASVPASLSQISDS